MPYPQVSAMDCSFPMSSDKPPVRKSSSPAKKKNKHRISFLSNLERYKGQKTCPKRGNVQSSGSWTHSEVASEAAFLVPPSFWGTPFTQLSHQSSPNSLGLSLLPAWDFSSMTSYLRWREWWGWGNSQASCPTELPAGTEVNGGPVAFLNWLCLTITFSVLELMPAGRTGISLGLWPLLALPTVISCLSVRCLFITCVFIPMPWCVLEVRD